jgi:hypothetical protein
MASINATLHDVTAVSITEVTTLPGGQRYQDVLITFDNGSKYRSSLMLVEGLAAMPACEVKA